MVTFGHIPNSIRLLFAVFFLCTACVVTSQELQLNLAGNEQDGFYVEVYNGTELLFTDHGAFNLKMANLDLSTITQINSWKGQKGLKEPGKIILERDSYIADLDAILSVTVIYEKVNSQVIRKRIRMAQYSMPSMYYTIEEVSTPSGAPSKYMTFEYEDFPGGFVHELFPAAGFLTQDSLVVGFLTDAGYRNHFTRTTRRRFSGRGGGFVGMRILPDPALIVLPTQTERKNQAHYIKYTFGEMYSLDAGSKQLIEPFSEYKAIGKAKMVETGGAYMKLACDGSERTGFELLTNMEGQKIYTISFECRGNVPLALKLYQIKDGEKGAELEHGIKYIDRFPVQQQEWARFEGSILVPYIENRPISMFIGSTSREIGALEIKGLQVVEHSPLKTPYNVLPLGQAVEKTTYLFVEPWESHQQFMISAQTRLAEGMGFQGTQLEKMLYANMNMLTWITSIHDFTPFIVPNMNYAPDMYNRDSFWSIIATYNKKLNLQIWEQWGKTQNQEGAIGTIITPYMGRLTKDKKGYAYLSSDYQPFGEFGKANYENGARDGYYYNGGSWMRAEYCAYVVGLKHGWDKASKLMENRAWAEIHLNPRWPFSKEFIPTQWQSFDSWWDSTRGLSRNVFVLMANECAGLRIPEMDPDFKSLFKFRF